MVNLFQDVPNTFRKAMNSLESEQWQKAMEEEYEGLIEMGIWKLVLKTKRSQDDQMQMEIHVQI